MAEKTIDEMIQEYAATLMKEVFSACGNRRQIHVPWGWPFRDDERHGGDGGAARSGGQGAPGHSRIGQTAELG
jgi:hypothetical protein